MTFWIKLINDNKLIGTHKRVECAVYYTEREHNPYLITKIKST